MWGLLHVMHGLGRACRSGGPVKVQPRMARGQQAVVCTCGAPWFHLELAPDLHQAHTAGAGAAGQAGVRAEGGHLQAEWGGGEGLPGKER